MATHRAVRDRSQVDIDLVKLHIKGMPASTEEDDLIELMLQAAKGRADTYLQNDFAGGEVPQEVEMWVLETVTRTYEHRVKGQKFGQMIGAGSFSLDPPDDYSTIKQYRYCIFG